MRRAKLSASPANQGCCGPRDHLHFVRLEIPDWATPSAGAITRAVKFRLLAHRRRHLGHGLPMLWLLAGALSQAWSATLLVEAESFAAKSGWLVGPQSVEQTGSPYLLAHGLGTPVGNASTQVTFPGAGSYHLWVRTRDWVRNARYAAVLCGKYGHLPGGLSTDKAKLEELRNLIGSRFPEPSEKRGDS